MKVIITKINYVHNIIIFFFTQFCHQQQGYCGYNYAIIYIYNQLTIEFKLFTIITCFLSLPTYLFYELLF